MMDMRARMTQILAEQSFPAARWELITLAELYGADSVARGALYGLPEVRFRTLADVLHAVERGRWARLRASDR